MVHVIICYSWRELIHGLRISDLLKLNRDDIRRADGNMKSHINIIEKKTKKVKKFPMCNGLYEEIENIPDEVSKKDIESRKEHDLRKDQIFTLDGISTKDMDDAIGIKLLPNGNYEISVHIAEPNHYAKPGTALFEEARKRKFTMYLLNTAIHMFPPKMANGICSLNEKVDRLTKSVIMEIDKNGNIVNSKVCKSVINSKKKMTYDDVNSILENDIVPDGYEPFVEDLKKLEIINNIISERREKEGLIKLETSKTNIPAVC